MLMSNNQTIQKYFDKFRPDIGVGEDGLFAKEYPPYVMRYQDIMVLMAIHDLTLQSICDEVLHIAKTKMMEG